MFVNLILKVTKQDFLAEDLKVNEEEKRGNRGSQSSKLMQARHHVRSSLIIRDCISKVTLAESIYRCTLSKMLQILHKYTLAEVVFQQFTSRLHYMSERSLTN